MTVVLVAAGITIWLISTGGCSDPTANTVDAGGGAAKQANEIVTVDTDLVIELSGDNTDIKWTGSNSIGQTPTGFFYELSGRAIVDGTSKKLKNLEVTIDMEGVRAMSESLTYKLKHKGFFDVDRFPESTFVSTSISHEARPGDPNGTNCVVEGNFQLRDVTQSITIPMEFSNVGGAFGLKSEFKLNRKDYGVIYSDSTGDKLIRDAVLISINIDSEPDQNNLAEEVKTVTNQPLANYTDTIAETLVEFDMVLVPGDEAAGIKPFFIGKTEVTWEEFDYWALCKNMSDKDSIKEISMQLRPSSPHDLEKIYRGWGRERQPVVGVSRKSAELYCEWLSAQTGRSYRLPTATEWDRAFELGGGKLDETFDSESLSTSAWFDENAVSTDEEGFDQERAMPVGTLKPNALGIYDMLGNASEWVVETGDDQVVRGGHFKLSAEELTGSHRETEDQNVWNRDYPQDPKSKWWYVNADYVGFRVVCDPR